MVHMTYPDRILSTFTYDSFFYQNSWPGTWKSTERWIKDIELQKSKKIAPVKLELTGTEILKCIDDVMKLHCLGAIAKI